MRTLGLLLVVAGLVVAADAKDDAADLKKLDGTWVLVSGEEKGEKLAEKALKDSKLVISGKKHDVKVGDTVIVGTHTIDAGKTPKEITASDTEGPYKDKTVKGIYKLEGDEFTVCFAPPGKDRPKEFTTKSGSAEILHVWKRKK